MVNDKRNDLPYLYCCPEREKRDDEVAKASPEKARFDSVVNPRKTSARVGFEMEQMYAPKSYLHTV